MLHELHISNLAVIEDAQIDLTSGLNVFTGETGAGKSLILEAFWILLGKRQSRDILRTNANEGRVTGLFEVNDAEVLRNIQVVADISDEDISLDEPFLLTRKLFASGRSSSTLNGQPITLPMLRKIGSLLIDLHTPGGSTPKKTSQGRKVPVVRATSNINNPDARDSGGAMGDAVALLKPSNQLEVVDRFAGLHKKRAEYARVFRQLRELTNHKEEMQAGAQLRTQQLELYHFQADEIDAVEPTEGEFEEIAARYAVLSNLSTLLKDANLVQASLHEGDASIIEQLQASFGILRPLCEIDPDLKEITKSMESAVADLQDASFSLTRYTARLDLDQSELGEVQDRLNALNRLIAKYGDGDLESVLAFRQHLADSMDAIKCDAADSESIDTQIEEVQAELQKIGSKLHKGRIAAIKKLRPLIESEFTQLAMPDAKFDIAIESRELPGGPDGCDTIEMLIQTNPGQAMRPLRHIASGGELSRIMLAIKTVLAKTQRISVLIFDEIDAKIGGRLGSIIGSKLRSLAQHHQVLCITHLPQMAAFADNHLKIEKETHQGRTTTSVLQLADDDARLAELSEMLAGRDWTETTRNQARELLAIATESHPEKP